LKRPEVSVIVPIYNGSAYLTETLNSLLSQTCANIELLAIDDGSTDASSDIVRSMKDDRVRLIRTENFGLCHALNLGITEARAPFIARSDQDDISDPKRLERQLQIMREFPEAIGLFAYSTKFGRSHCWSNKDKLIMAPGEVKEYEPLKDGCMLGSTMFARTSALQAVGGFRQSYYPADDWDLEFRLSETGKVLILCEVLIAYRFQTSANTYRVFAEMQEKKRWAKDSYRRRLKSMPELTIYQFRHAQANGAWSRFHRYCKDSSKLHMRTAGQRVLDGSYLAGLTHLFVSVMLNPKDFARRVRRYIVRS